MSLARPKVYYDTSGGYYYVVSDWGWASNKWKNSARKFDYGNVGGLDVHGVFFSESIRNLSEPGSSMAVCNKKVGQTSDGSNSCYSVSTYSKNNQFGTAIQFQDKAFWQSGLERGFTNSDRGSLVMPFKRLSSGCLQVWAQHGHSYETTRLTGVDIGEKSFGISWAPEANRWEQESKGASLGC